MGMFDKDKLYSGKRLDVEFIDGEEFIIYDVPAIIPNVPTNVGGEEKMAKKTVMTVAKMGAPTDAFFCGTFASAIAEKAEEAEANDFPAVVSWTRVPSNYNTEALVLQFLRRYDGDRIPQEEIDRMKHTAPGAEDTSHLNGDEAKSKAKSKA